MEQLEDAAIINGEVDPFNNSTKAHQEFNKINIIDTKEHKEFNIYLIIDPPAVIGCNFLLLAQDDGICLCALIVKDLHQYQQSLNVHPEFCIFHVLIIYYYQYEKLMVYFWKYKRKIGNQGL